MLTELLAGALGVMDALAVTYVAIFFALNFAFLVISYARVRKLLQAEQVRPASAAGGGAFLPTITLLVPAYNEEVTIAESVRSLLRLQYPAFEIVICNDGSKDRTVDVLRREFHFVRADREYHDHLQTAPIRAFYESRMPLPRGLLRLVLIDKENGGKADALNAAINVAQGEIVTSMDADSVLMPDALLRAAQPIADDPAGVIAVGAQVGLANDAVIEDGRVTSVRLPRSWIARFQVVEYMRSFAQGRTALAQLDSLLVLSGVFALIRRELLIAIGGFLTPRMRSRVGVEYCGDEPHTVCEDMEVIVRLHRYLLDHKVQGKVVFLPFPVAWTEAPENYHDLGKQRARWYRGLLEVLAYHREMIGRRRYRQVGLFAMPYQLLFEAAAPFIECVGYVLLLCSAALDLLSIRNALLFLALATMVNLCLSSLSVLLCVFSERGPRSRTGGVSLFPYSQLSDVAMLLLFGFLSNFGYRQYLLYWQLKGFKDFVGGKRGWDKFARKGFLSSV
jgi:cellulose synthase/poly-beta-1,6-N-acetylglucosamine synthase-like glycosyltransferase